MSLALALDLGGTKVEAALVDDDGTIVPGSRVRSATGAAAGADVAVARRAIAEVVERCLATEHGARATAVGIGSAGPIDLTAGAISPINLPAVHGFEIVPFVRAASGLDDVTLRLDGTCIALAELWRGAARTARNAVVIVVSTGVGGGIVSDGRLIAGQSGNAGHVGQLLVAEVGAEIAASTVEGIASGPHTVAWARRHGWQGDTGEQLAADVRTGDEIAIAAVERSARAVAAGLVNAATLLDLEVAVVGGGFSLVADDYIEQIQSGVRAQAVNAYAGRLRVVRAALGGDAPLIGAGALVHRRDLLGA